MLYRFPPAFSEANDPSFLTGTAEVFAKLKIESHPGQRTVLMSAHTLIFVLQGTKRLHFGDTTVDVGPGKIFLLKKGIYVMAEYLEQGLNFEALMLFLPARILRSIQLPAPRIKDENRNNPYFIFSSDTHLQNFCEQLRQYFRTPLPHADQLMPIKQQEALWLLSAQYPQEVGQFIRTATTTANEDLEYVVKTNLFQPLTLAELAALTNRSLATFKRDFSRLYGMAPGNWITEQRLNHAQLLLKNTDQPVAEVGFICGFENPAHFTRAFKRKYGYTPSALRADMAVN